MRRYAVIPFTFRGWTMSGSEASRSGFRSSTVVRAIVLTCLLAAACTDNERSPRDSAGPPATKPQAQAQANNLDPRRTPPRVASVEVEPLAQPSAAGNALLMVRFVNPMRADTTIRIRPDDKDIELRDDGTNGDRQARDGVFSAVTTLDLQEIAGSQRRMANFASQRGIAPQFEGRRIVRRGPPPGLREDLLLLGRFDTARFIPTRPIKIFPIPTIGPVVVNRSLMITDVGVVRDPTRTIDPCTAAGPATGKWTFGHLMTAMANQPVTGMDPATFTRNLLAKWETTQTVNGFAIQQRSAQMHAQILDAWQTASGGAGAPLDLTKAPFRLLAIVNRVDLRENLVYGSGSGGEARFVFGAVKVSGTSCQPLPFTVIFEYGVPKNGCRDVRAWAQQWTALSALVPGSTTYNAALEAITDQFAEAGKGGSKPNGSALNQLRTNEIALGSPWELREFVLDTGTHDLLPATVKQTPDTIFNHSAVLANYVNANAGLIVIDRHQVPLVFPAASTTSFLGASAPTPGGMFWGDGAAMTTPDSRFHLSLNTCNACHAGETNTKFTHVSPSGPIGAAAGLSGFLTGISVTDPDPSDTDTSVRDFNDLLRRQTDLNNLANSSCLRELFHFPLLMTH